MVNNESQNIIIASRDHHGHRIGGGSSDIGGVTLQYCTSHGLGYIFLSVGSDGIIRIYGGEKSEMDVPSYYELTETLENVSWLRIYDDERAVCEMSRLWGKAVRIYQAGQSIIILTEVKQ